MRRSGQGNNASPQPPRCVRLRNGGNRVEHARSPSRKLDLAAGCAQCLELRQSKRTVRKVEQARTLAVTMVPKETVYPSNLS